MNKGNTIWVELSEIYINALIIKAQQNKYDNNFLETKNGWWYYLGY